MSGQSSALGGGLRQSAARLEKGVATLPGSPRDDPANGNGTLRGADPRRHANPWRYPLHVAARVLGRLRAATATLPDRPLILSLSARTRARAVDRLSKLRCFRSVDYLSLNPDVGRSRIDPRVHALFLGTAEGRTLFRPAAMARALGALVVQPPARPVRTAIGLPLRVPRIGIYVSTQGNVFMREIAEDLAAALSTAGAPVELLDETADIAARPPVCVFVAPHEFFLLGRGRIWAREDVVASAIMLNTEQVQTSWFVRALPFVLASRGVIDLCGPTSELFAHTGLPSLHVGLMPPPGGMSLGPADREHPLFRILPAAAKVPPPVCAPLAVRPIEIAFFGAESPHREAWFARNAAFLADYETFIHVRRLGDGPIRSGTGDGALTRLARHVGGHARISLNLHRDAFGYLEWHRIVRLGMASGSVVVSEPCLPHPVLTPGIHYLEANARQIPDLLEWLLRCDEGRERATVIQRNAATLLAGERESEIAAAQVLSFLLRDARK